MARNPSANLDVNINGNDGLTPVLNQTASSVIRWVGAVSSALAAVEFVSFPVRAVREFQREMANVQKTTNFTNLEIKSLARDLRDMSLALDLSATDLAKIAAAAGQQGLGREGVEGVRQFTESVARMSSVLDITVEEAGTAVGKLSSIFKVPLREIEAMVSSFNQVANNSTARGEELLDVVRRIGDAAGSLNNYSEAIALGASAIDFGVSPEVAGTSITKIFADMQSKAEKFSEFMGMSTKQWIDTINEDGVGAFKMYLERLRGLSGEYRQKMIRELSGTGRIGALMNKFVNDTLNGVLDKNLEQALNGMESGTSAIREQQTVLQTLDAQIKMTSNSFTNLAIVAGEQFAKPLSGMMAELREALSSPEFISTAQALGQAFLDVFQAIRTGLVYVSELNVNWDNLLTLATALLGLKVASFFGSMLAKVPLLSAALGDAQKMMDGTTIAMSRMERAANAFGFRGQLEELRTLTAQVGAYRAARREASQAEKESAAAEAALDRARSRRNTAYAAMVQATRATSSTSGGAVAAAEAAAAAAQAGVQAAQATATARFQAAMQRKEVEHQTRLAAITAEYDAKRAAARAANDESLLRRLREQRAAAIQAEDQFHARSLQRTEAYHRARVKKETEAAQQIAAIRQQEAVSAAAAYSQTAGREGVDAAASEYRRSSAELERLKGVAAGAAEVAASSATRVSALSRAYSGLAAAAGIARAALSAMMAVASKLFFWGTIVYMILDAVGAVDMLSKKFQSLTDAMGLTSAARRAQAQEDKNRQDALRKEQEAIADTIAKYKELVDARTGRLTDNTLNSMRARLQGDNPNASSAAREELMRGLSGAYAIQDNNRDTLAPDEQAVAKQRAALKALQDEAAQLRANIARQEVDIQRGIAQQLGGEAGAIGSMYAGVVVDRSKARLREIEAESNAVMSKLYRSSEEFIAGQQRLFDDASADIRELMPVVAGMFTDASAALFDKYRPMVESLNAEADAARANADRVREELAKAQTGSGTEEGDERIRQLEEELKEYLTLIENTLGRTRELSTEMDKEIRSLAQAPGVPDATIKSLYFLAQLLSGDSADVTVLARALAQTREAGLQLTGALAPAPAPSSLGDGEYNPQTDSDRRRMSRARLAMAKASIEAEHAVAKEADKDALNQLEVTNDRALISMAAYYRRKGELQQRDISRAIQMASQERAAVAEEMSAATDEAGKLESQARLVRLDGEIAALMRSRETARNALAADQDNARRALDDSITQQAMSMSQALGGKGADAFALSLANQAAGYRDFVARLRVEAEDMPELLPLIDQIQVAANLQAVEDGLRAVERQANNTADAFGASETRLSQLRDAGVISSGEFALQAERMAERQKAAAESYLRDMEAMLAKAEQGSEKYKELTNQVEQARLKVEEMQLRQNEYAKQINDGITSEIGNLLGNFKIGDSVFGSIGDSLLNVVGNLQQQLGSSVAEMFMSNIQESLGGDGIGGVLANLFGFSEKGVTAPTGAAGDALHVIVENQPVFGNLFDGADGGSSDVKMLDLTASLDSLPGKLETTQDGLVAGMGGLFSRFLGGIGGAFSGLLSGISGLFNGNFTGAVGGIFGGITSLFAHTGATVGGTGGNRRTVPAAAFIGAPRYHSGTLGVGLKPNEVPAVLERGETVRTEQQEAALQRQLRAGKASAGNNGDGAGDVNVYIVAPDQAPTSLGPNDVKYVISDDISRRGPIYGLLTSIKRS